MTSKMDTFGQRVVRVVVPSVEEKKAWRSAAEAEGFGGNVSAWIKTLVANHQGGKVAELEKRAGKAAGLQQALSEAQAENKLLRDAYAKAQGDLQAVQRKYDQLLSTKGDNAARLQAVETLLHTLLRDSDSGPKGATSAKRRTPARVGPRREDMRELLQLVGEMGYNVPTAKPKEARK